jgi:hypothetical protein
LHPHFIIQVGQRLAKHYTLEEWETGVHATVDFMMDNYRDMYETLTDVNIWGVLNNPYYWKKLEAMWAHVYGQAW